MIAPCGPHATSAVVLAGGGGVFFGGGGGKMSLGDFKGLGGRVGWSSQRPAPFPEIPPQLGKNTETRPHHHRSE